MDHADLKINRATKHLNEVNDLFRNKRPFTYILEGNTQTGDRATRAKKNEPVIQEAALICGDVVHNIRTALDHAYWAIVFPLAAEPRNVQFPFSETAARLDEAIANRLAKRVSDRFFQCIRGLKPHGETGGNELLYLIHKLDIVDRHRLLIPTGDYTRLSSDAIRRQVPDLCFGVQF